MPQKIRQKSGAIKVSLHAAVLCEVYDRLETAARRNKKSMGEIIDEIVGITITQTGFIKKATEGK